MGAQWKKKNLAANAKGRLFGTLATDIMIATATAPTPSPTRGGAC